MIKQQELDLREKQTEHRRKQNEMRERFKEEAAKREQMKKGITTYSLILQLVVFKYLIVTEIDQLYDKRREIISNFRKQQEDYLALTREQRDAERTQRQEEAKRKEEARQTRQRERYRKALSCCIQIVFILERQQYLLIHISNRKSL